MLVYQSFFFFVKEIVLLKFYTFSTFCSSGFNICELCFSSPLPHVLFDLKNNIWEGIQEYSQALEIRQKSTLKEMLLNISVIPDPSSLQVHCGFIEGMLV